MYKGAPMLYNHLLFDTNIRKIKVVTDIMIYIDIHDEQKIYVQAMPADNFLYHQKHVSEKQFWELADYAIETAKLCRKLALNCEYSWDDSTTKELIDIVYKYNKNEIDKEKAEKLITSWGKNLEGIIT